MQKTFREIIGKQIPMKFFIVATAFTVFLGVYGLWMRTHAGTVIIHSPAYGSQVFINGRLVGTLREAPSAIRLSEQTGKHNIIVSKEGYWPWMEDVEIKKHEATEIHPFIVPQNAPLESIPQFLHSEETNPEYAKIAPLFENQGMNDEMKLLAGNTRIKEITHADYFPGRADVLLIAAKDGIFAIGTEKSEHPNFQPVYKGAHLSFAKVEDGTLYIKDGDVIFRIKNFTP